MKGRIVWRAVKYVLGTGMGGIILPVVLYWISIGFGSNEYCVGTRRMYGADTGVTVDRLCTTFNHLYGQIETGLM